MCSLQPTRAVVTILVTMEAYVNKPNMLLTSFIDVDAWNRAGWVGAGFLTPDGQPPVMGLMFRDKAAGREIFEGLRQRLGSTDEHEELQVSIIEGPIAGEPAGYTVYIGSNIHNVKARAAAAGLQTSDEVFMIARYHRMEPTASSPYLGNFKKAFQQQGVYGLVPIIADADPPTNPEIQWDLAITKRAITFLQAGQLTKANPEWVVLGKKA
jgi:hypothetical protein